MRILFDCDRAWRLSHLAWDGQFGGILAFLLAFVGWFFRKPDREVPSGEDLAVSPADGLVVVVSAKIDSWRRCRSLGPRRERGTAGQHLPFSL
jgi:hypothetical protein